MKMKYIMLTAFVAPLVLSTGAFAAPVKDDNGAHKYPADNSGKNKRDTKANELTAQDQSGSDADVEMTRSIREAIVKESTLSTSAHNVKIIVAQNSVTLKGPVKEGEDKIVVDKARALAPKMKIVNQLEIMKK